MAFWLQRLGLTIGIAWWWSWPTQAIAGKSTSCWELVQASVPEQMQVERELWLPITLRNCSPQAWLPLQRDRLAYHWRTSNGDIVIYNGKRSELPHAVAPGETVTLTAKVVALPSAGSHVLQWAMLREEQGWWPEPWGARFAVDVSAQSSSTTVNVEHLEVIWPSRLRVGQSAAIPIALQVDQPLSDARGQVVVADLVPSTGQNTREHKPTRVGEVAAHERVVHEVELPAPSESGHFSIEVALANQASDGELTIVQVLARSPAAVEVEAPALRVAIKVVEWPEHCEVQTLDLDADNDLAIDVTNTGVEPWFVSDALAYQWLDPTGQVVHEGRRLTLGQTLAPGGSLAIKLPIAPPPRQGRWLLRLGVVREHVRWFDVDDAATATQVFEIGAPALQAALHVLEQPRWLWRGQRGLAQVRLQNVGHATWRRDALDHLTYHWLDDDGHVVGEGFRTRLPQDVAPGETVDLAAIVVAWDQPGTYTLRWGMVREHVRWHALANPAPNQPLAVLRFYPWCAAIFAGALLLGAWRLRRCSSRWTAFVLSWKPALLLGLVLILQAAVFHELAQVELQERAWIGLVSSSAIGVAMWSCCRSRWRWPALVLGLIGQALILIADLIYVGFFGALVSPTQLAALHQVGEVQESIHVGWQAPFFYLLAMPAAAGVVAVWGWRTRSGDVSRPLARWTCIVAMVLAWPSLAGLWRAWESKAVTHVFSELNLVRKVGVHDAHALGVLRTIYDESRRRHASAGERGELQQKLQAHVDRRQAHARSRNDGGLAVGANVLLLQVEAMQGFVLDLAIDGQVVTPFMNAWASEQGLDFRNIVDQSAEGKTSDAEYLALQSNFPLASGALAFRRADHRFYTLAHLLREQGYTTYSAHPYERGFWNRATLHPRYGFSRSEFRDELGPGQMVGWGLADGVFFERVLPRLAALPQPWFGFLITLSLHHPYESFPAELKRLELGDLEGTDVGNWMHAMHYFDRSLAALLQGLAQASLLDHTIVAVYGDHDARFPLQARPALLRALGETQWREDLFQRLDTVPFLLRLPGPANARRGRLASIGGQIDIAPTLAHALGLPLPRTFMGHPLPLAPTENGSSDFLYNFAAFSDGSARTADRLFIRQGLGIAAQGWCEEPQTRVQLPIQACQAQAHEAAERLLLSRRLLDLDVLREWAYEPAL